MALEKSTKKATRTTRPPNSNRISPVTSLRASFGFPSQPPRREQLDHTLRSRHTNLFGPDPSTPASSAEPISSGFQNASSEAPRYSTYDKCFDACSYSASIPFPPTEPTSSRKERSTLVTTTDVDLCRHSMCVHKRASGIPSDCPWSRTLNRDDVAFNRSEEPSPKPMPSLNDTWPGVKANRRKRESTAVGAERLTNGFRLPRETGHGSADTDQKILGDYVHAAGDISLTRMMVRYAVRCFSSPFPLECMVCLILVAMRNTISRLVSFLTSWFWLGVLCPVTSYDGDRHSHALPKTKTHEELNTETATQAWEKNIEVVAGCEVSKKSGISFADCVGIPSSENGADESDEESGCEDDDSVKITPEAVHTLPGLATGRADLKTSERRLTSLDESRAGASQAAQTLSAPPDGHTPDAVCEDSPCCTGLDDQALKRFRGKRTKASARGTLQDTDKNLQTSPDSKPSAPERELHRPLPLAPAPGVNWRDRNLAGSDLRGTDLSGAILYRANLSNSDLRSANLSDALLIEANLNGANLSGANLKNAVFKNAKLMQAVLREANLFNADSSKANVKKADLSHADISRATLLNADLNGAILVHARLDGVNARDLKASGADFTGAEAKEANMRKTKLFGAKFVNANLEGSRLEYARLHGADFKDANLKNTSLLSATLSFASFERTKTEGLNVKKAKAVGVTTLVCDTMPAWAESSPKLGKFDQQSRFVPPSTCPSGKQDKGSVTQRDDVLGQYRVEERSSAQEDYKDGILLASVDTPESSSFSSQMAATSFKDDLRERKAKLFGHCGGAASRRSSKGSSDSWRSFCAKMVDVLDAKAHNERHRDPSREAGTEEKGKSSLQNSGDSPDRNARTLHGVSKAPSTQEAGCLPEPSDLEAVDRVPERNYFEEQFDQYVARKQVDDSVACNSDETNPPMFSEEDKVKWQRIVDKFHGKVCKNWNTRNQSAAAVDSKRAGGVSYEQILRETIADSVLGALQSNSTPSDRQEKLATDPEAVEDGDVNSSTNYQAEPKALELDGDGDGGCPKNGREEESEREIEGAVEEKVEREVEKRVEKAAKKQRPGGGLVRVEVAGQATKKERSQLEKEEVDVKGYHGNDRLSDDSSAVEVDPMPVRTDSPPVVVNHPGSDSEGDGHDVRSLGSDDDKDLYELSDNEGIALI